MEWSQLDTMTKLDLCEGENPDIMPVVITLSKEC